MFYGKRIKNLESQVKDLNKGIHELKHEMTLLRGMVSMLTEDSLVTSFEIDDFIEVTEPEKERIDIMLKKKENYEKKLRQFIRSSYPRKKAMTKKGTNGKETPKATE